MFKGRDFDQSAIPLSVRWYLAYNLSPPDLEEMMIERGLSVDQSTVHCWVVQFSPALERFNRRKRAVTGKWQVTSGKWTTRRAARSSKTYVKVRGQWMSIYRAIYSVGHTAAFFFVEKCDMALEKFDAED